MPTPARRRWVLLVAAFFVVSIAVPAAAHTDLVSSDPQQGQTLTTAPDTIRLTFGEDLLTAGDRLVAEAADGASVDLGPSSVKGAVLSADWPTTAGSGQYTVSYRAVAEDGHPLEGRITFQITDKSAAPSTVASPSPVAAPTQTQPQASSPVRILAPALLIAALLGAGFFVWRSRAD